jgi:CHASE3 domain sensor protein
MSRPSSTLVTKLGLFAALALLGITALTSYSSIQRFFEAAHWVDHTRLVMLRLEELMSELEHAESRQRGYLISGNEQYLEPYRAAVQALPGRIRALRELTADNPERQKATGDLAALVSSHLALTEHGIELKRTARFDLAVADPHLAQGRAVMDQMRAAISAMKTKEEKLLENRTASFARDRISTTSIIVFGNLIALAVLLSAFTGLVGEIRERKKAEAKTQRYADEVAQANAFLDSVFEYVPDMIFVKDAQDLRYVRFNQAGAALIGATTQELIGKSDYDFFPVEQADFFTRRTARPWPVECWSIFRKSR